MKVFLFKHNLTVKRCAADLGISVSYLYQILKRERKPSLKLAIRIENYTRGEVTVSDLIEQKVEMTIEKHLSFTEELIEEQLAPIKKSLENLNERVKKLENEA